jgi:hypothetical protein
VELIAQCLLEVVECQKDHCDVVKGLERDRVLHYLLHDVPADLVDRLFFVFEILLRSNPRLLDNLLIGNLVENTVT